MAVFCSAASTIEALEAIFSSVKDSENRDGFAAQLVTNDVTPRTELPYFARLVLSELLTSPGKLQQCSGASDKLVENAVCGIEVTLCKEVIKPVQIRLSCF
jgi:hypothetical protein